MVALAEIQKLAFREKLALMEALWESLTREEENIEVPQWHKDVLDEREKMVREGKAKFIDWDVAKEEIRRAIS